MRKERLIQAGFVVGGVLFYLLLTYVAAPAGPVGKNGMIPRDGYGGEAQTYEMLIEAEDKGETKELPVTISVAPRSYSKEEAEKVFEVVMSEMEGVIRGENPSLMEVSHDLNLPKSLDEYGIRLRWSSSNPEILDASGRLKGDMEAEKSMSLFVQLSADEFKADYEIAVRLIPVEKSEEEAFLTGLLSEIQKRNSEQKYAEQLQLPSEYEGRSLRYRTEEGSGYEILPFLGILLAVIWPARKQSEQRKREKEREQELLLDYAELVSKLMILTGAGMTLRNVWEHMVLDYESGLEQGKGKPRAAYEEMRYTWYQIKNGVSESQAYQDFGRRCRLQPYLKLSSLLEQNRRTGTKDLRRLLQNEMADAFELRKNLARRMGEEAGTKLLMPLFLMLGIIMIMIMVPAMMTMG